MKFTYGRRRAVATVGAALVAAAALAPAAQASGTKPFDRAFMTERDMRDMRELERASGAAFELRFMSLMTVHHTLAVERALRRAGHAEVRRLARAIVGAQERELDQFREWTVAWYAG